MSAIPHHYIARLLHQPLATVLQTTKIQNLVYFAYPHHRIEDWEPVLLVVSYIQSFDPTDAISKDPAMLHAVANWFR